MRHWGWMRRVLAALLALALLAAPGAPVRHAAAAPAGASHLAQAQPCHGAVPAGQAPGAGAPHHAPAPAADAGQDRPCDAPDAPPGLSCCAAGPCAGLQGAPPPALAGPLVLPATLADAGPAPAGRRGRDIPPARKPPRAA